MEHLGDKSVERFYTSFVGMNGWAVLAVQTVAWALGAAVTAMIAAKLWSGGRERLAPLSVIVGVAIPRPPRSCCARYGLMQAKQQS